MVHPTPNRSEPVVGHGASAPRRARLVTATALVVLLLCGACTASPTGSVADRAQPPSSPAPDVATPSEQTGDCGAQWAALDEVVSEQLAAFADDDWDRAFSLTSRQFRASGVDADGLRRIVTSDYAAAADAASHEVLACVRAGDEAQLLIEVTARDGAVLQLVYLLTREDGRWRISGAVDHGGATSEPPTVTA